MTHISLHSLLLEQVFGLYLVIMAIIFAARAPFYRRWIDNLEADNHWIIPIASLSLLIGIGLVVVHNFWVWRIELIVTILAWLILIKSILWLAFPESMVTMANRLYNGIGIYIAAGIMAILGILLLAHGFYFWL